MFGKHERTEVLKKFVQIDNEKISNSFLYPVGITFSKRFVLTHFSGSVMKLNRLFEKPVSVTQLEVFRNQ